MEEKEELESSVKMEVKSPSERSQFELEGYTDLGIENASLSGSGG